MCATDCRPIVNDSTKMLMHFAFDSVLSLQPQERMLRELMLFSKFLFAKTCSHKPDGTFVQIEEQLTRSPVVSTNKQTISNRIDLIHHVQIPKADRVLVGRTRGSSRHQTTCSNEECNIKWKNVQMTKRTALKKYDTFRDIIIIKGDQSLNNIKEHAVHRYKNKLLLQ